MTSKVLVTGGAGFVGSHLVDALIARGDEVVILDSLDAQVHPDGAEPGYLNHGAKFLRGDVSRVFWGVGQLNLADYDAVVHLAAAVGVGQSMYQINKYCETNVMGTARLLDALANTNHNVKRLVVASSMSIYGEGRYCCENCGEAGEAYPRTEDYLRKELWEPVCPHCFGVGTMKPIPTPETHPVRPTSVYAVTKRDQEELCLSVGKAYGINTTALRYFNIYGPRQSLNNPYTGVCAIFQQRIKAGQPPVVYEDGRQCRDFTSVHDITQANLLALNNGALSGKAFNVGTGQPTSILQVAETLAELYESKVEPKIAHKFRAGDIRHCYADISEIRGYGYEPKMSLKDGLRELCEWGAQQSSTDKFHVAAELLERKNLVK